MTQPYIGEIRMFGGPWAPQGWALCNGQLMTTSSNEALFSLLGTIYGGDGRTTFGLPDLRGRAAVGYGTGPGLNNVPIGQKAGHEKVTLTSNNLAGHTHSWMTSADPGTEGSAVGAVASQSTAPVYRANVPAASHANLASDAINMLGGGASHNNMMPFLAVTFIISLYGVYPSRT